MIETLQNVVSVIGFQGLCTLGIGLIGFVTSMCWLYVSSKEDDTLERHLGVKPEYSWPGLPEAKIDVYYETKEKLRLKHAPDAPEGDDNWMASLPFQEKDLLKYYLMQRAIGDMSLLRKIDGDTRGYWKLFSKGIVTQRFWTSVVEAEQEVSDEVEDVKTEAAAIEPNQDPEGLISEALQWLFRFGDKMPPDPPAGADPLQALHAAAAAAGLPPNGLGGLPGMGGMPTGMPNMPGMGAPPPSRAGPEARGPPQDQPSSSENGSGDGEGYKWTQDSEEVEVTVMVSPETQKKQVKVVFKVNSLRVENSGEVLCEGKLAARCEPEASTWTLSKGRVVCSLAKADSKHWQSLFIK